MAVRVKTLAQTKDTHFAAGSHWRDISFGSMSALALVAGASILAGLSVTYSPRIVIILLGASVVLYGVVRTVRPALYALALLSTLANVLPIQLFGLSLGAGLTLNFWDQLIIVCILLPWAVRKLFKRETWIIPWSKGSTLLVLLLGLATLGFGHGLYRGNSFDAAIAQYRPYMYAVVVLAVASDEIKTREHLKRVVGAWLFGAAITGPIALVLGAVLGDISHILPNLFTNPGSTGAALPWRLNFAIGRSGVLGLALLLPSWVGGHGSKLRVLGAVAMTCSVALSLTRTHYAVLGLVIPMVFILSRDLRPTRALLLVFGALASLGVVILASQLPAERSMDGDLLPVLVARLASTYDVRDTDLVGRITEAKATLSDIQENPILGTGLGGTRTSAFWSELAYSQEWNIYHVHNSFLDVALQLGIVGLTVFLLALAWFVRLAVQLRTRSCTESPRFHALLTGILVALVAQVLIGVYWPDFFADAASAIIFAQFAVWLVISKSLLVNDTPSGGAAPGGDLV